MNDTSTSSTAQNFFETSQNPHDTHSDQNASTSNAIETTEQLYPTNLIPSVGSAWVAQFMETVANNTSIQSAQENGPHDNYEESNGAGQNLESSDGNSNLTGIFRDTTKGDIFLFFQLGGGGGART